MEEIKFKIECKKCYGQGKIESTGEPCFICNETGLITKVIRKEENNERKDNS